MYHYTYITWNDHQLYIGVRSCKCLPEEDLYIGSQKDKTYKPTHKSVVKVWPTRELAIAHEIDLHNWYEVGVNSVFANRAKQTSVGWDSSNIKRKPLSDETKGKLSQALRGRKRGPLSDQHRLKLSIAAKKRIRYPCSEETKLKISKANKGRVFGEEFRIQVRNRKVSEETRLKISKARKNIPLSDAHKEAIGKAHRGRILSDTRKKAISDENRKRAKRFIWICLNGVSFEGSVPELVSAFPSEKLHPSLLRKVSAGLQLIHKNWAVSSCVLK